MKLLLVFVFLIGVFNNFSNSLAISHSNLSRNLPKKQIPMQNVPLQIMPDFIDIKNSSQESFHNFENTNPLANIMTAYPVVWPYRFPRV